jgi:hypothetical protein
MKFDLDNVGLDNKELTFGKYKGSTPLQVAEEDPAYIVWMYDNLDYKHCTEALRDECEEIASIDFEAEKDLDEFYDLNGWGH